MTSCLGLIHLLEQLTELRKLVTYIYHLVKGYEEIRCARSGRFLGLRTSVPVPWELACVTLSVHGCVH